MFLPPRRGRRRPVTPGISSTSQRTSALLSALGMLLRYTVEGAPRGGSSLVETSPFGSRGDDDGGGGDDDDGVIFGEAKARSQLAVSRARAAVFASGDDALDAAMARSTSRTLMPCGWCFELVRNSRTTPRVSLPVPWSAFNTMSTSAPTEMSARLRPSGSPGRTCAKRSSVDEHVTVNERRARDGASPADPDAAPRVTPRDPVATRERRARTRPRRAPTPTSCACGLHVVCGASLNEKVDKSKSSRSRGRVRRGPRVISW